MNNTSAKPNETKLNVKLVYPSLIHSEGWEGPCRPSAGASGDEERSYHRAGFNNWVEYFKKNISPFANFMKPELVEYIYADRDFKTQEENFRVLEADKDDVDLYILTSNTAG